MRVFGEFFESGEVNFCTNASFIRLIPNKEKSVKIGNFRPISLVTSLYKILDKVLSKRIRDVLGETISPSLGAFVHRRQILDVVLVANEIVDEYRLLHKEGLIFKVDFEKAYDYVDWGFLDFVLEMKGFDFRWRKWIWGCVSSCNMSVIVNGRAGNYFFSNDTIFFSAKEKSKVCNLLMILRIFEVVSGHKVNLSKSSVVGITLEHSCEQRMAAMLGCPIDKFPLRCLGLPLGGDPRTEAFWNPVFVKIGKRLERWK
ncbi:uncharacterized protein LOC114286053 [Camellia sinensis]|uniref:uncharacterized protein LOC114286053 n=1 Tax=Camellia sinensis TaxID=4442 RepID=UPI0010368500|nr:uncharacterized protein LOC114286053 [Camellia sinensis]